MNDFSPQDRVEQVDPARAAELLALAPLSYTAARFNARKTVQYTRTMRAGDWSPVASVLDAVAVTDDGRLYNGLNRLVAIILSGTTQPMTVITGTDPAFCLFSADLEATP